MLFVTGLRRWLAQCIHRSLLLTMLLLDLPAETFARVIHLVVEAEGVRRAFKYRAVCNK